MEQGWQHPLCSAAVDIVFYVKDPMNENKPLEWTNGEYFVLLIILLKLR